MNGHAAAGARGGQATTWTREPCPSWLPLGDCHCGGHPVITCQQQQVSQGSDPARLLTHRHRWTAVVDGRRVTVTWTGP